MYRHEVVEPRLALRSVAEPALLSENGRWSLVLLVFLFTRECRCCVEFVTLPVLLLHRLWRMEISRGRYTSPGRD